MVEWTQVFMKIKSSKMHQNMDMPKLLISDPRVDPTTNNNMPLKLAHMSGNAETYDVLKNWYIKNHKSY